MRVYCRFFLLMLGIVALWGCGGAGINKLPGDTKSVYAGIYKGAYTNPNGENGTLDLSVTDNGTIFGTLTNTTIQKSGPFSGVVRQDGNFRASYHYTEFSTVIYDGRGLFTGAGGTISAVFNISSPDKQTLNLTLTKQ